MSTTTKQSLKASEPTGNDSKGNESISSSANEVIRVVGAETHNLRCVDLDLPRNELIVFCGASGSGKTSMAIDTLYAEGQRRYIESFSAYTRQFIDQLDKPDVERIEGLPPAIAVTRGGGSRSNRTTVATSTEVADHLRLLFARVGKVNCEKCGERVRTDSVESVVDRYAAIAEGRRAMIGFDVVLEPTSEGAAQLAEIIESGFVRAIYEGETLTLSAELVERFRNGAKLTVITDRLVGGAEDLSRPTESIETALAAGDGACVLFEQAKEDALPETCEQVDGKSWVVHRFDIHFRCSDCNIEYAQPEPQLFNFNSPLGACELCQGFGSVVETDMDLVVPDRSKSLREGAVAPWTTPAYAHELEELLALAADYDLPVDVPFDDLNEEQLRLVIEGVPDREFGGLNGFFRWLERRKYKMHLRVFLSRWRSYRLCDSCLGARLKPEALAVRVGDQNFSQLCQLEIREAIDWFDSLALEAEEEPIAGAVLAEVKARLLYLSEVGVGYLTLDRSLRTLSTGESQRVGMTATLGSNLVDMLYVLDEPSTGLHPVDVAPLTKAIRRLRDRGNTVIVVEHEEEVIRVADHLVEFGPQAGLEGGQVVYEGPPAQMLECRESRTGDWLSGRRMVRGDASTRTKSTQDALTLTGATGANLRAKETGKESGEGKGKETCEGLNVKLPLGLFCVVTGVSGAGKSSLIRRTLYPALADEFHGKGTSTSDSRHEADRPLPYAELLGTRLLDDVVFVDQQPIGRSPRSNPVTYIKAFDPIRTLFAEQPEAKSRDLKASHFSFNVDGGRCEGCQGAGFVEIDMQFLADIYMKCRECNGRRYKPEVLEVKHRGRDIAEVLDMTAHEALRFFRGQPKIQSKLKSLLDVGLDYLQLGQPANTLSGGEAQRLKLAGRLSTKQAARTLFLLDEPTTGLHFSDVEQLIDCFKALIDVGHSVIVIEHNLTMMMSADWLIDLGPGAADEGGRVVAEGTPEKVAKCKESATGRVLAEAFARRKAAMKALEEEERLLEEADAEEPEEENEEEED